MADDSKTEKATPKRRRDERKKGNVLMSQDVVSVVTLIGSCLALQAMAGIIAEQAGAFMAYCIELCQRPVANLSGELAELAIQGLMVLVKTAGPLLLVTVLCAVTATFYQTRLLVTTEKLRPKLSHLNPLQGFKRLFSLKSVVDALKGILKISVLMVIIYQNLQGEFQESVKYLYTDVGVASAHLFQVCITMMIQVIIAFIVLAAFDYLYQWWEFERNMRMSKQEIKEEFKQLEGDPQVKGRIKEIQRRRSQARMMQQVPKADVVIKNPTHFAVALRYHPEEDNAPIVLAKGQDELALRIIKTAQEHQVAVIENVSLARALYAQAELDREIPPELYGPVAEVLVYIFKLNEKQQIVK